MNYVMECHLATGHSLSSQMLKVGTIWKYLIAAASFVAIFDSVQGRDAHNEKGSDSLCPALDKVLKEQKWWEDVPDRREGWTVGLQLALMARHEGTPFLGKHQAIIDWFVVALHGSFCRVEWAQDRGHSHINMEERNARNNLAAFCLDDIQFKDANSQPLTHSAVLSNPVLARSLTVRWRMQKNGDHGEKKLCTCNNEDSRLCCVHHWIHILQRFVEMHGFARNIPLACYWSQYHDSSFYITSENIETAMRETAASYYELDLSRRSQFYRNFRPIHSVWVPASSSRQWPFSPIKSSRCSAGNRNLG
jgi:hypothetical protein